MKIFSLFFLLLFFFACTQQQNDSEVVLAASPEQTLDLEGEILPIQELIPMSICRLDTFLVILNMEEEKIVRVYHADTYRFLGAFFLTSSLRTPKFFVKEFSYFLMPCHQHGLRINLLVQR